MFVGLMIVLAFLSVSVSLDSKISLIIYFLKWNWKIIWVWWRLQCYFCLLVDNMTWPANLDRKINIKRYTCVCVCVIHQATQLWLDRGHSSNCYLRKHSYATVFFPPVLSNSVAIRIVVLRPKHAKQIYFHKCSIKAPALMIHSIVVFYQNFMRIFFNFGLLQPQQKRLKGRKEKISKNVKLVRKLTETNTANLLQHLLRK